MVQGSFSSYQYGIKGIHVGVTSVKGADVMPFLMPMIVHEPWLPTIFKKVCDPE